jgi:hypothetical protein
VQASRRLEDEPDERDPVGAVPGFCYLGSFHAHIITRTGN